jgi:catechol 2,3-dioxygenase-like lactoylglutathione lyase family enzyme
MADASTQTPPPVGLGHASMTVADLEASYQFYTGFGLRTLGKDEGIAILELRGGTHLLLFQAGGEDAEAEVESPFDEAGVESLDLMIAGRTLEDLTAFRDGLVARGIAPGPILDRRFFGHHVFKARDPDGNEVTVSTSHASHFPI